jgi:hypothetical protein
MTYTVIGIDPGHTTGFVKACLHDNDRIEVVDAQEIAWESRFDLIPLLKCYVGLAQPAYDAVVMESFNLFSWKAEAQIGSAFPSAQIIGIADTALYLAGTQHMLHMLPPAVKARISLARIQDARWQKSEHLKDAVKLIRYYIVKHVSITA